MTVPVSARALSRDVGYYLRQARRRVVAVTYFDEVAGYLISPDVYARLIERAPAPVDGHQAAVARMDEAWARR